jgi:hypothetical protein
MQRVLTVGRDHAVAAEQRVTIARLTPVDVGLHGGRFTACALLWSRTPYTAIATEEIAEIAVAETTKARQRGILFTRNVKISHPPKKTSSEVEIKVLTDGLERAVGLGSGGGGSMPKSSRSKPI